MFELSIFGLLYLGISDLKMAAITESVDSGVGEGIENRLVKPEESDQVKKLNPEAKEFIPCYKKEINNQSLSSGDFAITKKHSGGEEFNKQDGRVMKKV